MNITEETRKMIDAIKCKDEALRKNNSIIKHYFTPDIPEKVIKKLIKNFDSHLPVNSLIAYYDTTLLSTCRGGVVFTNDGFYYKYIGKAIYFRYTDIIMMEAYAGKIDLKLKNEDMSEYTLIDVLDMEVLINILKELIDIDRVYGQTSAKGTGKIKKIDLPPEKLKKCNMIIHSASAACGGVGTGLAQIPGSDNAVIVPIQIGMIVGLGSVFDLNITESAAKSIIASSGATVAGRTASQFLVGWIPGLGNAINTATAAGLTEVIGWIAVKNFYDRWMQDINKGRMEGMKDGYREASEMYEQKLRKQAAEFIEQKIVFQKQKDEYEKLLNDYEEYIENLEKEQDGANLENSDLSAMKKQFSQLKNLNVKMEDNEEKDSEGESEGYERLVNEYEACVTELERKQSSLENIYGKHIEISEEYERKLKEQAEAFIKCGIIKPSEISAYDQLIYEYEIYINLLEKKQASSSSVIIVLPVMKNQLSQLKNLSVR